MDITDFAQNHPAIYGSNAGNGHEYRVQAGDKIFREASMGGFHKEIGEMSQVQGSNAFWHRSLFLECIDSFLMQTGFEKILKFRKDLIHIGSQLYF